MIVTAVVMVRTVGIVTAVVDSFGGGGGQAVVIVTAVMVVRTIGIVTAVVDSNVLVVVRQ